MVLFLNKKNLKIIKLTVVNPFNYRVAVIIQLISIFLIWYLEEYKSETVNGNFL